MASVTPIPQQLTTPTRARRRGLVARLRTPGGILGVTLVSAVVLAGLLAPLLTSYAPTFQIRGSALQGPSAAHLLGTDDLGRDLWSRVLYGIRVDLAVGLLAVPLAAVVGALLGLVASSLAALDVVVQRFFDVILAFPALILGLAVSAAMGGGMRAIVTAIFVANVPVFGRLTRDAALIQQAREYVRAARLVGAGRLRVLTRHVLPNVLDPLVVQLALAMSLAVFIEGGLSFIGIGIPPEQASLGNVLNQSIPFLTDNPAFALGPIAVVVALVVGLNLIADALNKGVRQR